jgi:hypothetical protein
MKRTYRLDSKVSDAGRTLWNNLVLGHEKQTWRDQTRTLDKYTGFIKVGNDRGIRIFNYNSIARVSVIALNNLEIESETPQEFTEAEQRVLEICATRGIPLHPLKQHPSSS